MPSPLSASVPLPVVMVRPVALRLGPSMSLALANSSAWVMTRAPLSSAIGASVTGVVVGASLAPLTVMVRVVVAVLPSPSVMV